MLLARRLSALSAFLAPLLTPALVGGSDATHLTPPSALAPAANDLLSFAPVPDGHVDLRSPGHGPHTSFQPATAPRELILSFDDGPDLRGTPLILDELDRRGLKAIFFVSGWRMAGQRPEDAARRDLVRKIAAHGHLVANHTLSHHNLCQNPTEQAQEIDANAQLIEQTTGIRPLLFRSPYGAFCQSLEAALEARDLPDVGWNLDPQDWKSENEDAVYAYLTSKVARIKGRGILLLHDTHLASVHALPRFLDWLARDNARALREHTPPVNIIDYRVLVPRWPVTASGLPELVGAIVSDAAGSIGRYIH